MVFQKLFELVAMSSDQTLIIQRRHLADLTFYCFVNLICLRPLHRVLRMVSAIITLFFEEQSVITFAVDR